MASDSFSSSSGLCLYVGGWVTLRVPRPEENTQFAPFHIYAGSRSSIEIETEQTSRRFAVTVVRAVLPGFVRILRPPRPQRARRARSHLGPAPRCRPTSHGVYAAR